LAAQGRTEPRAASINVPTRIAAAAGEETPAAAGPAPAPGEREAPTPERATAQATGLAASTARSDEAAPKPIRVVWSAASETDPSIFGTVALRVGHTPLDAKWRPVAAQSSHALLPPAWAALRARLPELSGVELLETVNEWVNRHVTFASDEEVYGQEDHWATLAETAAHGRGDCEDFAIAKMQLLRAAGVPARSLFLVIARDLVRRADHALLLVELGGRFYVLDAGTSEPMPADQVHDYRPIMTFSAERAWIHGYRPEPRMLVASNSTAAPLAP
jgi:predicted transglutaminase-like cysteine proteinase